VIFASTVYPTNEYELDSRLESPLDVATGEMTSLTARQRIGENMSDQLLNVSGITAGTEDASILHGIDLTVGAGETHVLMGPNGAGKSTLGHVIMGDPVYKVTAGSIAFDGQDITTLSADKRSLAASSSPTRPLSRFPGAALLVPAHHQSDAPRAQDHGPQVSQRVEIADRSTSTRASSRASSTSASPAARRRRSRCSSSFSSTQARDLDEPTPDSTSTPSPWSPRASRRTARPAAAPCS